MKICALIPAYNEENQIETTIKMSLKYVDTVIVINDDSIDETENILKKLKKHIKHLDFISNEKNLGKAESVKRGLNTLLNKGDSTELIVQIDADLSHSPGEIPDMICARKHSDMIIGNRYVNRTLDPHRSAVINLASLIIKELTNYRLTDPMCGFRLYTRKLGEIFSNQLITHGYALETEQILISKLNGKKIKDYNLKYIVKQDEHTKAIEFIDILNALINYSDRLNTPFKMKQQLSSNMQKLLNRETFTFTLGDECITFKYLPNIDSYTLSS